VRDIGVLRVKDFWLKVVDTFQAEVLQKPDSDFRFS